MNAFNIPLSVYRNRCWEQSFALYDANKDPLDVSQDALALVVIPVVSGPTNGAAPVISNLVPTVTVNVVIFDTPDAVTGTLTAGKAYNWQLLRKPAGAGEEYCTSILCAGPLLVNDSPPFPEINP